MQVNDLVHRNEVRPFTAALIQAFSDGSNVQLEPYDPDIWALILYEEGGQGWWPMTDLLPDRT
ncbi:MAG: hypothetical protein Q7J57_08550 [Gemmobacter sp.]|nr:hypothetical protein [Gemmobacter sp.]